MAGTGPERVCGALAGKNRAIISAYIDAERKRRGVDPKTNKWFAVVWKEYAYGPEYLTLSDAGKTGAISPPLSSLRCVTELY